jgi:hypothetical protein
LLITVNASTAATIAIAASFASAAVVVVVVVRQAYGNLPIILVIS